MLAFHTAPARLGAGTLPAPALRQPPAARVVAAAIVSVAGSLAADAALVTIATAVSPSTRGYGHFLFHDYARLTVIGAVIACWCGQS